tara:strand:- start:2643 stop:2879 length:237 start_codon:yes stop_codon:yes gene_type:complete
MTIIKNMAYWKAKNTTPLKFGADDTINNSIGGQVTGEEGDDNEKLIEALKKQDEVDKEVDKLKEGKKDTSTINPGINV